MVYRGIPREGIAMDTKKTEFRATHAERKLTISITERLWEESRVISDVMLKRLYTELTNTGGERRCTEIARALVTEPKFLLLDEPFAGIDPIAVYEIKQIIRRLAEKGIGILITDHNVREVYLGAEFTM